MFVNRWISASTLLLLEVLYDYFGSLTDGSTKEVAVFLDFVQMRLALGPALRKWRRCLTTSCFIFLIIFHIYRLGDLCPVEAKLFKFLEVSPWLFLATSNSTNIIQSCKY